MDCLVFLHSTGKSSSKYAQIDITATDAAHKTGTQHALGREEGLHTLEQRRRIVPQWHPTSNLDLHRPSDRPRPDCCIEFTRNMDFLGRLKLPWCQTPRRSARFDFFHINCWQLPLNSVPITGLFRGRLTPRISLLPSVWIIPTVGLQHWRATIIMKATWNQTQRKKLKLLLGWKGTFQSRLSLAVFTLAV